LSARVRGLEPAAVRAALYEDRSIVKTWSLRGTLHLVAAGDVPMWEAAVTGGRRYWESQPWLDRHGLTRARSRALIEAIGEALHGVCLTRTELVAVLEERLGWTHPAFRSGFGELLQPAAMTGRLCFGPPRGAAVTFVRADEWLGGWPAVDPGTARRETLRRFLAVYGPARSGDFASWSGFGGAAARGLFEQADLDEVRIGRIRAFVLRGDTEGFDDVPRSIRLLAQYDAYILGSRPRDAIVPEAVKQRIKVDPKGRFEAVTGVRPVVVDGIVTGLWWPRADGIEVEHVISFPRGRKRELAAEIARVAAYRQSEPATA
jgi:hypothetical protein